MNTVSAQVDPQEVAYYERLAETWWDDHGPFWPLHRLNRLRVRYILEQVCANLSLDRNASAPLTGVRILDVGCGGGILSEAMARLGADVLGIDVVEKNIQIARRHADGSGLSVRYEQVQSSELRESGVKFDVVLNMEVVEHVPDARALIRDCIAMLAPGGVLVIATINRTLLSYLLAIVGAEYVLRWLPRGTHQWRRFVKPEEISEILESEGLGITGRSGVKVNPFNRRFTLTPLMAVNYMLVAKAPREHTR